jgi:hypothetical protein
VAREPASRWSSRAAAAASQRFDTAAAARGGRAGLAPRLDLQPGMMIYRSLVVGLLAAIAMLLAEQGAILERIAGAPLVAPADDGRAAASVVHISWRGAGHDPAPALGLGSADRVVAIDHLATHGSGRGDLLYRWGQVAPGDQFELWIDGPAGRRRMLVLVTA